MEFKIEPEWTLTDIPQALIREAQTLQRLERVPEAIEAYSRIVTRWPHLADCWYNLGVLQKKQGQLQEALASYRRALELGIAAPEEVHLNRAVIYSDHLRQDLLAQRELEQALTLNPGYAPALLNLANLNEDLGRRTEASTLYQRLLALDPRHHEALARYANLQPGTGPHAELISQLESALQSTVSMAERASLGFALGRLLDAQQQYPAAFAAYSAANRANRAGAAPGTATYDRKRHEAMIDLLIGSSPLTQEGRSLSPQARDSHVGDRTTAGQPDSGGGDQARPEPIFICGLFRSGSTLTEQLLARHPGVIVGGELDLLPRLASALGPLPQGLASASPETLASLAARYGAELGQIFPGAQYVTDKRLDNFLRLGLIKELFPRARIVHTTRDPLDNCLSIFFLHLDPRLAYAHELLDIGHYFRQYRRLMTYWKRRFGDDLYEFNYDTFVRHPAAEGARLFEFLGLQWDDRYLEARAADRAVKTASVWQVREPIYTRSSGRAANYAAQLGELRAYLSDLLPSGVISAQ